MTFKMPVRNFSGDKELAYGYTGLELQGEDWAEGVNLESVKV